MTKSEILTQAKILARRAGLTITNQDNLYLQALQDITSQFDILPSSWTGTISDGMSLIQNPFSTYKRIRRLSLPSLGILSGVKITDGSEETFLIELEEGEIREMQLNPSDNTPVYYATTDWPNPTILLYPTPSAGILGTIYAWIRHPLTGTDPHQLGTRWDNAIIAYLARLIALQVNDYELAGVYIASNPRACTGLGRIAIDAILDQIAPFKKKLPKRVQYVDF